MKNGAEEERMFGFTKDERTLLGDVLDMHLDGMRDAMTETIADMSIESLTDLLNVTSSLSEDRVMLQQVRERLR